MQYQKDEVRKSIIDEAIKEFNTKGYKAASIRSIAKNSGTSVGNIYKYFASKEELYENLIGAVYHKVMEYINQFKKVELNDKAEDIFYNLLEKIMEIFDDNRIELAILLNKSEGSKYENCKVTFVDFITRVVTEVMEYGLSIQNKKLKDNFIIYLLSYSLVESISITLKEKNDEIEVRKLILNLIDIFYKDVIDKLEYDQL
ncbi:TetR/AcrR family transcriptional regulator [Clostridium folliculivorans]|uniref:TetR family transcriptional regulator n=1 Tax=Clostridium folliculivorans TaxID=2886038 RepID=A0A9W5Y186_9CLOT|nr:TetR/AcrR family transcriptional regulator [Clostridium folliculivorans]GKU24831.1 TetR family transcriptional regulator [Clostridium folliculivorans]GKU30929.1 TetR family transcriptional regulator [Clostridium folliculivorans]